MRLLQLDLGSDSIIDLHPLVSVVTGLDVDRRRRLAEVVAGLAAGSDAGSSGLLEAHGVLFDLSSDLLALLDISSDGLRPVVTAGDLPAAVLDPKRRDRVAAERSLSEIDARLAEARQRAGHADEARRAALDAVERARAAQAAARDHAADVESLRQQRERAVAEQHRLGGELAELEGQVAEMTAAQSEPVAATVELRRRLAEAEARRAELSEHLDRARRSIDPNAPGAAQRAADTLSRTEAEVEAERAEEQAAAEAIAAAPPPEPPAQRVERIEQRTAELQARLAAFVPAEVQAVSDAVEAVRPSGDGAGRPSPEAVALADELEAVDGEIATFSAVGSPSSEIAGARTRLNDAQRALEEAELAVRHPELDRDLVERLEQAHAELLDALDKADSRFGGSRSRRRADELRQAENAVLDELGFTSYSDYMMGISLLHVDHEKEATLDAARAELSSAEDHWRSLEADTEAELAHAETVERRRLLLDRAGALLGSTVPPDAVVRQLRELRVDEGPPDRDPAPLRAALEAGGLSLGDDDLPLDDLLVLADAWLEEVAGSSDREKAVRDELDALGFELLEAQGMVERGEVEAAPPVAERAAQREAQREARLRDARERAQATEARRLAHVEAEELLRTAPSELSEIEASVEALTAELTAAPDGDEVDDHEGSLRARLGQVQDAVATGGQAVVELEERIAQLEIGANETSAALAASESHLTAAEAEAAAAAELVAAIEEERAPVLAALEALGQDDEATSEQTLAEEIEWYILARLAAQRSVSLAGSLPLLLDDALVGLGDDELHHVLGRLERMAQAVQIIVVTDDPVTSAWAETAGANRAAVVRPEPA